MTSKIKITGKQGHVAYPQWTLNPINPLTKILSDICNIKLDSGTDDFPPSNIEVVKVSSSEGASNVVPQSCYCSIKRYDTISIIMKESLTKIFDDVVKEDIPVIVNMILKLSYNNSAEPFLTEKKVILSNMIKRVC